MVEGEGRGRKRESLLYAASHGLGAWKLEIDD
jgi:hypothetical protein